MLWDQVAAMTTHETLVKARAEITDPANWCQYPATDQTDHPVCAMGVIARAAQRPCKSTQAYYVLRSILGNREVGHYNDTHSHECVIAAFDAAIEATVPAVPA